MKRRKKSDWKFYFELSKPCLCGKMKDSENISVLAKIKNGTKWMTGFSIIIRNSSMENAVDKSQQMANRLANLIIGENRTYRYPILKSFSSADGDIYHDFLGGDRRINESEVSLDFTNSQLNLLLKRDSRINQQLSYYARGCKAIEDNDPITAIKEFFQVFNEEDMPKRIKGYKPLRDVLSHPRVTNEKTKKLLLQNFSYLNFGFRNKKFHLDTTSTKNMKILREIAVYLKGESFFYMWKIFV